MTSQPILEKAMTWRTWAMLLTLSLIWGGSFFFQAVALQELPTFTIVVARVGLAALTLLVLLPLLGVSMPRAPKVWGAFFIMGLVNNALPFSLIIWGQATIASGHAAILNATMPLFTVIVAHLVTSDEKVTWQKITGIVIGFLGVAVMIGTDLLQGLGGHVLAQLAILGAALSYAFASTFGRRFNRLGVKPVVVATGQVTASSVMLFPVMLFVDRPWTLSAPSLTTVLALIGLATISTAFAYILYFRIMEKAGATNLSLVTFLIPPSAIILGILFLGEALLPSQFAGMVIIGLGLALIDGRPLAWLSATLRAPSRQT